MEVVEEGGEGEEEDHDEDQQEAEAVGLVAHGGGEGSSQEVVSGCPGEEPDSHTEEDEAPQEAEEEDEEVVDGLDVGHA